MRVSRTRCRAHTWPVSTRFARSRTPRPATAIPRTARRSSTSPTERSFGCWLRTSRSTCATARSSATSGCSTSGPESCGGRPIGCLPPAGASRSPRPGWCRSTIAQRLRSSTWSSRSRVSSRSSSNHSWSPTRRRRAPVKTLAPPRRSRRRSSPSCSESSTGARSWCTARRPPVCGSRRRRTTWWKGRREPGRRTRRSRTSRASR